MTLDNAQWGVGPTTMSETLTIDLTKDYSANLARAAAVLRSGGVVAFPTETVYGVGARADLPQAVTRLRVLKGRTDGKPFTVHIAEPDDVRRYVPRMSPFGRRLIRKGWPGPITVLCRVPDLSSVPVLRDRDATLAAELYCDAEIGLRCPAHAATRQLLAAAEGPVVASSANRAGHPPPRTAEDVRANLGDAVDLLLDAGPADYGQPSTIVRLRENEYELVRAGVYDARTIRRLASMNFLFVCTGNTCRSPMAAGLFRQLLARRMECTVAELAERLVTVRSAGSFAGDGARAAEEAIEVMRRRGIDIADHRSSRLSPELIHTADRIYVMTETHAGAVTALVPSAQVKTRLLGEGPIEDPIGGTVAVYESCAARIAQALAARLEEVDL
jgi:tRNA threonylcarbamoyl adenosine modification protein (Sua5/YciO/YrdC/YwlC family)